ncbi:hypothetical protein [Vibrio metschnikovii]|uniref:hypothetical protein n=1 Tax=Vibrio metschnikovii TaxID=28172 RepID=UPI00315DFA19
MHKQRITMALFCLLLTACSNQPRQVKASLPLIDSQSSIIGEPLSISLNQRLNNIPPHSVDFDDLSLSFSAVYHSALGYPCRQIQLHHSESPTNRVVCLIKDGSQSAEHDSQSASGWLLMPSVTNVDADLSFLHQ